MSKIILFGYLVSYTNKLY